MAPRLTPQHLEDASKLLQGVALILRAAANSTPLARMGAEEASRALAASAQLLSGAAQRQAADDRQLAQAGHSLDAERQQAASSSSAAAAGPQAGSSRPAPAVQHEATHAAPRHAAAGSQSGGSAAHDPAQHRRHRPLQEPLHWPPLPAAAGGPPLISHIFPHSVRLAAAGAFAAPANAAAGSTSSVGGVAAAASAHAASAAAPLAAESANQQSAPATEASEAATPRAMATPAASAAPGAAAAPQAEPAVASTSQTRNASSPAAVALPTAAASANGAADAAAPAAADATPVVSGGAADPAANANAPPLGRRQLRERRVPSSPLGRAMGFAGMGAGLILGSLKDSIVRTVTGPGQPPADADAAPNSNAAAASALYGAFITEANAERLAAALCRMRGAALKLGQMLSIQDDSLLPPQLAAALERVRAGADVMPRRQLEAQLVAQLGADWPSRVAEFDWQPCAAASIGQVHRVVLKDGRHAAMKVQYPGVADSINADIDNTMRLIRVANILPKGLYVEEAVKVAKRELALECDYTYEARCQERFKSLIEASPDTAAQFSVPGTVPDLCAPRVLTTEWVEGVAIDKVAEASQEVRDAVGARLLTLTLRELFVWRFMQTDPNWGNFLYDAAEDKVRLIDFGAARDYPKPFVDDYLKMVAACAEKDKQGVIDLSTRLGFLTGDESQVMLDAHAEAGFMVGVPFAHRGAYDFGSHGGLTRRVSELGSVMLRHRLTPPPQEAYSLHRKLSGAFLACMKLKARVPCRDIFYNTYNGYAFGESPAEVTAAVGAA